MKTFVSLVVLISAALVSSCRHQTPPEHLKPETILKAMHDDMFTAHVVAESLIEERDGIDLLAERLAKNPAAAGALMDAMLRKGGLEKVFAERCASLTPTPDVPAPKGESK